MPTLDELLAQARVRVDAMTPAERATMLAQQRRSWVVGELMLEDDKLTLEEANARYDRAMRDRGYQDA